MGLLVLLMIDANDPLLFHFTHVRNLVGITAQGLCADGTRPDVVVECAEREIKRRRRLMRVPVAAQGAVADYVPFYFAPRSPMLYRIHRGGVAGYADGQRSLVYLVTRVSVLINHGLVWAATDRNAALADARYTSESGALLRHVDWDVMRARRWADTAEDGQRKQRRMAEFLVHERVPWAAVQWIVTLDREIADLVRARLTESEYRPAVHVRPGWYF